MALLGGFYQTRDENGGGIRSWRRKINFNAWEDELPVLQRVIESSGPGTGNAKGGTTTHGGKEKEAQKPTGKR